MRLLIAAAAVMLALAPARADVPPGVRFGDASADTTRINEILADAVARNISSPQERTAYIARQFIGIPYQGHTLEGPQEFLTVRLDSLDCTTFVETAMALSATAGEKRTSWRDYLYNLENLRYRGGKLDGYPSRLHYICDWAVDNAHRGNLTDVTDRIPHCSYVVRSIDFMSNHRNSYPALKDSANFARIRGVEMGYRNHRFPYIKSSDLRMRDVRDALRSGDVVGLVTKLKDLDVTHMGIIIKTDDGVPHLLHASSSNHKVELSAAPLDEFMKRNPSLLGIRVFRLND
ncbi:MAG: DUF1460 domain-containing protein [Muribaculaceae bacterium]|nr:DUF1460 domain-containing protein [Muribaculaceae bacterium]